METPQERFRGYMATLAFCQRDFVMTTFWVVLQIMRVHGFDCNVEMSGCYECGLVFSIDDSAGDQKPLDNS